MSDVSQRAKKPKSREYPAVSLRKAVEMARRVYDKDRFADAPIAVTVAHMGYAGLNGGSRPVLSALRKFGLLEYIGAGDDTRARLTDLAKKIILPRDDDEARAAISQALLSPDVYQEVNQRWPNWELPSESTLRNTLIRDFRFQEGAVKGFVNDLLDSIEYEKVHGQTKEQLVRIDESNSVPDEETREEIKVEEPPTGLMRVPMPGSPTHIILPERLDPSEARRILSWLKKVVTPSVEFAAEVEDE